MVEYGIILPAGPPADTETTGSGPGRVPGLSAQAWSAGLGWSWDSRTLDAWLPGGGGGPGPDTVIP